MDWLPWIGIVLIILFHVYNDRQVRPIHVICFSICMLALLMGFVRE